MLAANPYKIYKDHDLDISNPCEIVGKLYGAASVSLRRAVLEINAGNIEKANNLILKAENIVAVLDGSLDMSIPVSAQMHDLYVYMQSRMLTANIKKDISILTEIAGLLTELRETWDKAYELTLQNRM